LRRERQSGPPEAPAKRTAAVTTTTAQAAQRPIRRFIAVTGTLTAQEQADVAAEIRGVSCDARRRGTHVAAGSDLVRIAETEVGAQAQEAEANVRQIEARLAIADGADFQIDRVLVAGARSAFQLAQAEFDRARMLAERQAPRSDFDKAARRPKTCAGRRSARTGRAAVSVAAGGPRADGVARKAVADTPCAPFEGVVEQRLVSIGDYVT
jgi:membrane fusion protein (multidrug efflux system)